MAATNEKIAGSIPAKGSAQRNYQIDVLKLICTICVFLEHTKIFIGEKTQIQLPLMLGPVSVHFFFIVSGMFMVNSIVKSEADPANSGRSAMQYVFKKIKGISLQYWTALFVFLAIYLVYNIIENSFSAAAVLLTLERIFPEAFFMTQSGVLIEFNNPTWYISAMLISMLPLAYLLYKRRDLFLYVLAPLIAVFSFGYMYQTNKMCFFGYSAVSGFVLGGIIRAMCGLCFGAIAWLIYNKLASCNFTKKSQTVLITVVEAILWICFFSAWFIFKDTKALDSVLFILPVAIAIAFSRKSYISKLFEFRWMKVFSSASLAIYLNHWAGRYLVLHFFPECSYKFGVSMMALFTLAFCLVYFLIMKVVKWLWNKKLKPVFSNQPKQ